MFFLNLDNNIESMKAQYSHSTTTPYNSPCVSTCVNLNDNNNNSHQECSPNPNSTEYSLEHSQEYSEEHSQERYLKDSDCIEDSAELMEINLKEYSAEDSSGIDICPIGLSTCLTCQETDSEKMKLKFLHSSITPYNSPIYELHKQSTFFNNQELYIEIYAAALIEELIPHTST